MFNLSALNDVEFEYLCQDIMERKFNKKLHRFAKGKDGGIDLTDSTVKKNIIIQVKHYIDSTPAILKSSLKKELPKVQELTPKQYYICFSKQVSPMFKTEIYNTFSEFMIDDNNIITGNEITDFLENPLNKDIVIKHYKLWLSSSNVFTLINNQDIVIDSEMFLYDIKANTNLFVQTEAFNECLECLEKTRKLFILGEPGIGKSITT